MAKFQKRSYDEFLLDTPQITRTDPSCTSVANLLNKPRSLELQGNSPSSTNLCSRCAKINFKKIFSLAGSDLGPTGKFVTEVRKDIDLKCGFCAMVVSLGLRPDEIARHGYRLRALDSLRVLKLRRTAERVNSDRNVVLVALLSSKASNVEEVHAAITNGVITPLSPMKHDETHRSTSLGICGRRLDHQRADYRVMRSWVEHCATAEGIHGVCRYRPEKTVFKINVIDCFTRKIVEKGEDDMYLALSYVWGKEKSNDTVHTLDHVSKPAPATIEDAMQVVNEIGQRYLWVDRYCIPDSESKHVQIQNMHTIYEGALATIVAVAGTDADSGLPGVSLARRIQPCIEIEVGAIVTTMAHLSIHMSRSKWATRAWTYQEAILSKRCLFFTEDQVFFGCPRSLEAESTQQYGLNVYGSTRDTLSPNLMTNQGYISLRKGQEPGFSQHLSEYTSRSLSYDADGLNAFRGMLAKSERPTYWGVPIGRYPDKNPTSSDKIRCEFVRGLCWSCVAPTRGNTMIIRRTSFPTWSWASIAGKILSNPDLMPIRFSFGFAEVAVEDLDGCIRAIDDIYSQIHHGGRVIRELSPYLHLTGFMTKASLSLLNAPDDDPSSFFAAVILDSINPVRRRSKVHFDIFTDPSLMRNAKDHDWDVIALAEWDLWLILELKGLTAYRIGWMDARESGSGIFGRRMENADFIGEVKTIRLG